MVEQINYPLLRHAEQVRQAMLRRDALLLNKITRDYLEAYKALDVKIKTLTEALKEMEPTPGRVGRIAALENLLEGTRREMQDYAVKLGANIDKAMQLEMAQAGVDASKAVQLQLPPSGWATLEPGWTVLHPAQIEKMFGFLDATGPLYASLRNQFAPLLAEAVRDAIMQNYIQGMNPRQIGKLISKSFGAGLNWSTTMARTATLNAYRAASQQNYLANSDVVGSWTWISALDQRTCMGCVSKHGKVFPNTETLDDHHNGRCSASPNVRSWSELGFSGMDERPLTERQDEQWFKDLPERSQQRLLDRLGSGLDWFERQSPTMQKQMMGPGVYNAWKAGAFDWNSLSQQYNDPIYGRMFRQATLKELVGDQAFHFSTFYQRKAKVTE